MTSFAMVFPGQGSQSVGMLSQLAPQYPLIQELFQEASDVLNYDLWDLVTQGPKEKLDQTQFTQPALLVADVAIFRCWEKVNLKPAVMAGHSLGEYSAFVCAQSLSFADAVRLVSTRGSLMQAAVPAGTGAMAAIIGLEDSEVLAICEEAAQGEILSPANYNAIGQIVIAGEKNAVDRALLLAKTKGAKMAQIIPVSVPSHCALMQPAALQLATTIKSIAILAPAIPVIQNVNAASSQDPEVIRQNLIEQLTQPVRWVETIQAMAKLGIEGFVECGPGKILSGLNKRIVREIPTYALEKPESLLEAANALKKHQEEHSC